MARFWARRIRRLLPASLLVLALSLVATVLLLPSTVWSQTARQIGASALYVQNWALALDAVDYMAADNVPTVAQHYWSLSVEEQFYLVWPLLVLALVLLAARARGAARGWVTAGIAAVCAASLAWSVVSTAQDQSFAYFSTLTRAWEFGAGALAALVVVRRPWPAGARALLGWAGLAAIAVTGFVYTGATPFPGWTALVPVVGTVLVLVAGRGGGPLAPGTWLSVRPATFLGDISYSVYLWHWPLVVLAPAVVGDPVRWPHKLGLLVATLVLAWASKVWVEDPLRRAPLLSASPLRSFAFAVAGMVVVVGGAGAVTGELRDREERAQARAEALLDSADACVGPGALADPRRCPDPMGTGDLVVAPEVVALQNTDPDWPQCQQGFASTEIRSCEVGDLTSPSRTVALVGDSHATQWITAFDRIGRERGWKVVTMTKVSCPLSTAARVLPGDQTEEHRTACNAWVDRVGRTLAADPEVSEVFVTAYSSVYDWESRDDLPLADPGPEGFADALSRLGAAGKHVVVLAAVPRTQGDNVPSCLASHPDDLAACSSPRDVALPEDVMVTGARRADPPADVIDLSDLYCDRVSCYPVVGDVVVYRDFSHLSREYSTLLVPELLERYDALGAT